MSREKTKVPMKINNVTKHEGAFNSVVLEFGFSVMSYDPKEDAVRWNPLQNHSICCVATHPLQTQDGFIPADDFKVGGIMLVELPLGIMA